MEAESDEVQQIESVKVDECLESVKAEPVIETTEVEQVNKSAKVVISPPEEPYFCYHCGLWGTLPETAHLWNRSSVNSA